MYNVHTCVQYHVTLSFPTQRQAQVAIGNDGMRSELFRREELHTSEDQVTVKIIVIIIIIILYTCSTLISCDFVDQIQYISIKSHHTVQ